jgi:hypothetical protein
MKKLTICNTRSFLQIFEKSGYKINTNSMEKDDKKFYFYRLENGLRALFCQDLCMLYFTCYSYVLDSISNIETIIFYRDENVVGKIFL